MAGQIPEDITGWQVLTRVQYSVDGGASWHLYDPDGGIVLADDVPDDAPPARP